MVELRVNIKQNGRVLSLYTTCIEQTLMLTACNELVKEISKKYKDIRMCIEVEYHIGDIVSVEAFQRNKNKDGNFVGTELECVYSDVRIPLRCLTMSSPNRVYRSVGRIIDGLDLIKVVADKLSIFVNENGKIDYVSVVLESADGED